MNRRGFLKGLLGLGAAVATAPLVVRAALSVLPRGRPARKYKIPFHTISTTRVPKTVDALLAYERPITDFLERNAAREIWEIEDRKVLDFLRRAVTWV